MKREYIKAVIARIVDGKEAKNVVPSSATMGEIMGVVREDALECMRDMCNDRVIAVNKTLNSVAFKCL